LAKDVENHSFAGALKSDVMKQVRIEEVPILLDTMHGATKCHFNGA